MAIGMEEDAIFGPVRAAIRSPHQVMIVPPSKFGDFLVADRAEAVLFFPQAKQLSATPKVVGHFDP